jgi:cell shape-determining protein MreC
MGEKNIFSATKKNLAHVTHTLSLLADVQQNKTAVTRSTDLSLKSDRSDTKPTTVLTREADRSPNSVHVGRSFTQLDYERQICR